MTGNGCITARIFGGLGNQLFCYAAARRLALVNDVPLKLDVVSGFVRDSFARRYLLDRFAVVCEAADEWASFNHPGGRLRRRLVATVNRRLPFESRWYLEEERSHRFDPRLLRFRVTRPVYSTGYWQSERYFADIEDTLRRELRFRVSHSSGSRELAAEIQEVEAVSVHARTFSAVPEASIRTIWNTPLPPTYYSRAIHKMVAHLHQPVFYCFSDDLDWARGRLPSDVPMNYVDVNAGRGYDGAVDDLWLMSRCKHHVLSNSTFSWWGAWLGRTVDGIVIVPSELRRAHPDHYPEGYASVPVGRPIEPRPDKTD